MREAEFEDLGNPQTIHIAKREGVFWKQYQRCGCKIICWRVHGWGRRAVREIPNREKDLTCHWWLEDARSCQVASRIWEWPLANIQQEYGDPIPTAIRKWILPRINLKEDSSQEYPGKSPVKLTVWFQLCGTLSSKSSQVGHLTYRTMKQLSRKS